MSAGGDQNKAGGDSGQAFLGLHGLTAGSWKLRARCLDAPRASLICVRA